MLLDGAVELLAGVCLAPAEEHHHAAVRHMGHVISQPVVRLGFTHESGMLPYHHQALVRQKGQRFRRGNQRVGGRVVHQVFIQFLQPLRQKLPPQGGKG